MMGDDLIPATHTIEDIVEMLTEEEYLPRRLDTFPLGREPDQERHSFEFCG